MTHKLGEKSLACLRIAAVQHTVLDKNGSWVARNREARKRYGDKVIDKKFEDLAQRQYIEYGVSPHLGWLSDKGREALNELGRS